jgi:hypothetical protein
VTNFGSDQYPPPPPVDTGPAGPHPPSTIVAAFWGYVIAAIAGLLGGVIVLGSKQAIVDALREANAQNGGKLTEAQIEQFANVGIVAALVIAVIIALLYVLFAFKFKAGRNWARILLTVIAAFALFSLLIGPGGNPVGFIGELAAVIAAVLSYLPASNAYFAAVKAGRR